MKKNGLYIFLLAAAICSAQPGQASDRPDETGIVRRFTMWHILVKDRADADKIRKHLSGLPKDRLLTGFQDEARRNSVDEASGQNGGALGDVTEMDFERQFTRQAFSLRPQQLSKPIQSSFGWHLVYVTNIVERPVKEICDSAKARALAAAGEAGNPILAASLEAPGKTPLAPELMAAMGPGWSPPMRDAEGDVTYLRVTRLPVPGQSLLTTHKEYSSAQYYKEEANETCARSEQTTQEIDCETRTLGASETRTYEGRAAQGKLLADIKLPPIVKGALSPNSFGAQLLQLACGSGPN
jgi:hypothetical protein